MDPDDPISVMRAFIERQSKKLDDEKIGSPTWRNGYRGALSAMGRVLDALALARAD
jgi:hypothetical protein